MMLDLRTNDTSFEPIRSSASSRNDLAFAVAIIRRRWRLIALTVVGFFCLGLLYVITAVPRYTATADVLINTRKNQLLESEQVLGDVTMDAGQVESQVEVMKSDSIAAAVVKDLHLTTDPEFVGGRHGLLGSLLSVVSNSTAPMSQDQLEQMAIARVAHGITAKRIGLTYIIEVGFTSTSPDMAAKIVNAITDAYLVGELDAKFQASKRTSRWLKDRIDELREQANVADQKVQKFKKDNNIVETGRGLMGDQQLSAVNVQLVQARAATAEAKARLDRINQIQHDSLSVPDATIADALHNDVITRLRAQYLDLSGREANWSQRYGAQHAAAVNLRAQMAELKKSIDDEIDRIAETYKSDYEIANSREQSLQQSLDQLVSASQSTAEASIKLRDLDSAAQTYRNLYDSFLQKYEVATQQQSFPVTDARVVTPATPPTSKSSPKTLLILAASLAIGAACGAALAFFRENMNSSLRTPKEVENTTGVACLGILPAIPSIEHERKPGELGNGRLRHAISAPFSRFAETLRNIKVSVDLGRLTSHRKTLGIVSSLPREGKTTVGVNLAQLLAGSGKTLLVDCDLRNPAMTNALAPEAKQGLVEVLTGQAVLSDVICTDRETGLDFIPAVIRTRISNTAELVGSSAMAELLDAAKARYEYILLDFPPLIPVVDAKAASHICDGFLFVIEWGRTEQEAVNEALTSNEAVTQKLIGTVLNQGQLSAMKGIESYKGKYYSRYYSEPAL